jgi:hypothetical protein
VDTVNDVSDESPPIPEQPPTQKDLPELIWLRAFDEKDKYNYSKFEIESVELRALLHIELAHDPRFHSPSESIKNSITFTSPFEPLVHNWTRLEQLANAGNDSDAWASLKRRIAEISPRTDKEVETSHHSQHTSALVILADEEKRKNALTDYLWTIFPPGELVYSTVFMRKDQIFVVKESEADIVKESDSGRERDIKRV